MTSPFWFLSIPLCALFDFFFFYSPNEDRVLVLNSLCHPDEWPQVPWQATFNLSFLLFPPSMSSVISHPQLEPYDII